MLYKEWRQTRLKFGLMLALYALAGLLVNTVFAPKSSDLAGHSVFQFWVVAAIFVTIFAGVLGGVDAVAEENDKGTIGFLLAHPVSRRKVYTIKILLNSGVLAVSLAVSSLVLFFTQLIPRFYTANIWDDARQAGVPTPVGDPVVPPLEAVSDVVAILGLGIMLVCLSSLVSVFARSTVQAILLTFIVVLAGCTVIFNAFYIVVGTSNFYTDENRLFSQFYEASFLAFLILVGLAAAIYLLGLLTFKRREF